MMSFTGGAVQYGGNATRHHALFSLLFVLIVPSLVFDAVQSLFYSPTYLGLSPLTLLLITRTRRAPYSTTPLNN